MRSTIRAADSIPQFNFFLCLPWHISGFGTSMRLSRLVATRLPLP
jgi:hypothetical protein